MELILCMLSFLIQMVVFMPPPFEEWWRGIKCYPCPFVRSSVRQSVRPLSKFGVRSITFERLHRFDSYLVCWYIISKHRSSSIWVTTHQVIAHLAGASVSYGHISSLKCWIYKMFVFIVILMIINHVLFEHKLDHKWSPSFCVIYRPAGAADITAPECSTHCPGAHVRGGTHAQTGSGGGCPWTDHLSRHALYRDRRPLASRLW